MPLPAKPSKYVDDHLSYFTWPRTDAGYFWVSDIQKSEWNPSIQRVTGRRGPFLVEDNNTKTYFKDKTLDINPTIFKIFSEIKPDQQGFLEFANKYGLLTIKEVDITFEHDGILFFNVYANSLDLWIENVRAMKRLVTIWEWWSNDQTSSLGKVIYWTQDKRAVKWFWPSINSYLSKARENEHLANWFDGGIDINNTEEDWDAISGLWYGTIASEEYRPEIFSKLKKGDLYSASQALLQLKINEKLAGYETSTRLLWNHKTNRLDIYLQPQSLLSALWFQFARAVAGERKFKRCAICHQLTDVTENQANWSKHPDCANRDRVRRSKEKKL